jgi:hypothetical protein
MTSRRKFLLLGTAIGGLAVAGGGAALLVLTDRHKGWIQATLERALPGYSFERAGLDRFVDDFNHGHRQSMRLKLFATSQHLIDARWALPEKMAAKVAQEERLIVSDFLLGSNFFQSYPNGPKTITYSGAPEACASPFATF